MIGFLANKVSFAKTSISPKEEEGAEVCVFAQGHPDWRPTAPGACRPAQWQRGMARDAPEKRRRGGRRGEGMPQTMPLPASRRPPSNAGRMRARTGRPTESGGLINGPGTTAWIAHTALDPQGTSRHCARSGRRKQPDPDPGDKAATLIDNVVRRVPDVSERLGRPRADRDRRAGREAWTISGASTSSSQLGEPEHGPGGFNRNLDRAAVANPAVRGVPRPVKGFNTVTSRVINAAGTHPEGRFEMASAVLLRWSPGHRDDLRQDLR